ncbi:MAG TPA: Gfo/Idh/MocA family oxidoreductase [Candidatus Dormibacteraeota bacterium]|jgi:predicted dehydrogenase|nr:Gfo/Idh/MocA family oxidoreductase [Candidatus Dormibacteraeota bacterium]
MRTVRIGMLGSGFVADFYMDGLRDIPGTEVVANYSRSDERAKEFGRKHGVARHYTRMEDLCADRDVELVVIGLPNHLHLPATRVAAAARKAIVCTKPLARNGREAAEMLAAVRSAGVMHGYAETEVFSPDVMRARQMIESGAIGEVLTVRAREAHSGPHAPHFWDAETAGGGALLDMGCHTIEAARYFFGKENKIKDVFAWGATMVHHDKTKGEDNAVLLLRLEDGRTSLTEASWTAKGGMELRNEVYGTMGRIVTDTSSTRIRAFIQKPAGYLMEKADADVGWVFPIPDEARVYGYHEEMRHFVECFVKGEQPREDFVDGYVVNCVLDAAYRSMKSGRWEAVEVDARVAV